MGTSTAAGTRIQSFALSLTDRRSSPLRGRTSKFYGPFASSLPSALTPILNEYCAVLELAAPVESPYLFHPPQSQPDRPLEPSAWSGWVRRCFKRHHGEEIAPKTLRAVFVTWLRNSTNTPEVLKAAAVCLLHPMHVCLSLEQH